MEQQADEYFEQGRFEEAVPLYRRLLEKDHNNWRAHLRLGRCYFELRNFKKAFPHFQEVTRLAPQEAAPSFLAVAEIFLARGRPMRYVTPWFQHAADLYKKRNDLNHYQPIQARMTELGMDSNEHGEPIYASASTRLGRAQRSLVGLRVGDAFGGTFFWKTDLEERIRTRRLVSEIWPWSDDTAMGRCVVECLEADGEIVPDRLARLFADEYEREPIRGYGALAHTVLYEIGQGTPWKQAAGEIFDGSGSYGNGAAMRVGPVGAYFSDDIELVLDHARQSAMVTHAHPEGQAGALAVAAAAAWAARSESCNGPGMLEWAHYHTPEGDTRTGLERALSLPLERAPEEAASVLGSGHEITAQDTVPFALWCAARHPDSYPEALWATVAGGGDLDTTSAIVGSIVVLCAQEQIPDEWLALTEPLSSP